jgi:hypothetical protein
MWNYILINVLLSLAIILFSHYVWEYLKNTYSTKKTKTIAENKYKAMIEELRESRVTTIAEEKPVFLTQEEKEWMEHELAAFMSQ